ncbi:MAG: rod shape-determining protein MreC [Oscillospiraceae bacterium]|nr:rod shape-determining protein MreC [Oscillospiraceae bacterium]
MRHYFSTRIKVVLALAVVLAILLGVVGSLTGKAVPSGFLQTMLTPLRSGAYALTGQAQRLYNYIYNYDALVAENESLKQQLSQWQENSREADSLARENERLRQLLKLMEANPEYRPVDAYVIARSSNDWTSTVTINRGSDAGITVGMCAITANGEVVGIVTEVGSNYAVVKTVLDSSLEVSANIASSGYSGVVTGCYTSGHRDMLRMDYLSSSAIIRTQDQVVTAGSTHYPRNLILGYVVDAGFDDIGVAKYAILKPAADIANLEQVFIMTEYHQE